MHFIPTDRTIGIVWECLCVGVPLPYICVCAHARIHVCFLAQTVAFLSFVDIQVKNWSLAPGQVHPLKTHLLTRTECVGGRVNSCVGKC